MSAVSYTHLGSENRLYIADRQEILKIIDKDHEQNVIPGIFLPVRRREQVVFGVIVDHCLGHNLVIFKTGCFGKMPCKKCGDLVYIEIKVDVYKRQV